MAHEYEVFVDMGEDGTMTMLYTGSYATARSIANKLITGTMTKKDERMVDSACGSLHEVRVVCCLDSDTECPKNCGAKKDRAYYKAHPGLKAKHKAALKKALEAI